MIILAGYIQYPPGVLGKLREGMRKVIAATRSEAGNIEYNFAIDVIDENRVHISEKWKSQADLDAHMKQPHMAEWRATVAAAGGATERNLRIWDVSEEGKAL